MAIIFTIGGESIDLEELSSSLFVYLMFVVYYVPIAMLFAYSIFRNLAVMFRVTLLSGGATALCYDGGWFWYIILVKLCWLCAHHLFLKVNQIPFVLWISSKVMGGRKSKLRHIKNAEKGVVWSFQFLALKYMCLLQEAKPHKNLKAWEKLFSPHCVMCLL